MAFDKKWLNKTRDTKANVFPIWLNSEDKEKIMDLGIRIRQSKVSTIIKQAVDIALAKIISEEKISEILLNNERKNRRSGLEEVEILKNELMHNLKKIDKSKSDFD